MFKIDENCNIEMIDGDTGLLKINFGNYELKSGDRLYLSVNNVQASRSNMLKSGYLFQKIVEIEDEGSSTTIVIDPEDTKGLVGEYIYDIQLSCANGYIDTIVPPSKIVIRRGVTNE